MDLPDVSLVEAFRFKIAPGGKIWRRLVNGKWQYSQDPETTDEWLDRI